MMLNWTDVRLTGPAMKHLRWSSSGTISFFSIVNYYWGSLIDRNYPLSYIWFTSSFQDLLFLEVLLDVKDLLSVFCSRRDLLEPAKHPTLYPEWLFDILVMLNLSYFLGWEFCVDDPSVDAISYSAESWYKLYIVWRLSSDVAFRSSWNSVPLTSMIPFGLPEVWSRNFSSNVPWVLRTPIYNSRDS